MFEMTFLKNQHEEYEALAQIAEMESNEKALLSEKASEKGCAEMESAEKPAFEGYDVEHLLTISAIMREAKITPDDLRKCIDNFKFAAEIVSANIQKSMDKAFEEQTRRILNSAAEVGK